MDRIDRLLASYPENDLPHDFSQRVRKSFRRRYRRRQRILALISLALILGGLYFILPEFLTYNESLALQPPGTVLISGIDLTLANLQNLANGTWQNIADLQALIQTSFSPSAWLGLWAVGVGTFIGIGGFLPHLQTRP